MDNQQTAESAPEQAEQIIDPTRVQEAPESVQEAPMALHDEPDESVSSKTDDEPLLRPEYYPEKFWDEDGPNVENLAKSYVELERKFKNGEHKAPDGDYDVSALVDQGLDTEDPAYTTFNEWAKEHGVSQAAFNDLASKILELDKGANAVIETDRKEIMEKLGANAVEKMTMAERLLARSPLNDEEKNAIAFGLNSAEAINGFLKYHQSLTNEGIPVAPAVANPGMTKEDLEAAVSDPRWLTDTHFRTGIEKRWAEANG